MGGVTWRCMWLKHHTAGTLFMRCIVRSVAHACAYPRWGGCLVVSGLPKGCVPVRGASNASCRTGWTAAQLSFKTKLSTCRKRVVWSPIELVAVSSLDCLGILVGWLVVCNPVVFESIRWCVWSFRPSSFFAVAAPKNFVCLFVGFHGDCHGVKKMMHCTSGLLMNA